MEYSLYEKGNHSQAVAKAAFDDEFSAESWAREWAAANASSDDYLIEREDRKITSQLFRTKAGQWYIMRQ